MKDKLFSVYFFFAKYKKKQEMRNLFKKQNDPKLSE